MRRSTLAATTNFVHKFDKLLNWFKKKIENYHYSDKHQSNYVNLSSIKRAMPKQRPNFFINTGEQLVKRNTTKMVKHD